MGDHSLLDVGGHLDLFFKGGSFDGFVEEPGVFDRGGGLGSDRFEQLDFELAEGGLLPGIDAKHADGFALVAHSHGKHRGDSFADRFLGILHARIGAHVFDVLEALGGEGDSIDLGLGEVDGALI